MNANARNHNKQPKQALVEPSSLTVLQELTHQGHSVHTHCRNGECGVCRCKLTKGQVEYIVEPIAYIQAGDILPCVTRAKTTISVEVKS